jgi:hypothetical protein
MESLFRVTANEVALAGGILNFLHGESDALTLARVAMGESHENGTDRHYIMWQIRLRAELGFKNGVNRGWSPPLDRWGPATSIKTEALQGASFQYDVVRSIKDTTDPLAWPETSQQRAMLYPSDAQISAFERTHADAQLIVGMGIQEMPGLLRGYESHRSPSITGEGTINRIGGLPSRQFAKRVAGSPFDIADGNVWRDVYFQDNIYWGLVDCEEEAGRNGITVPDEGYCPP